MDIRNDSMDTRSVTQFFKGIAIFLVLLSHTHQTFDLPYSLNEIFYFFQIGVQLFMLLSAMGLCFSYSKSPLSWLNYMKKRLAKIAILYWFAILLAALYRVVKALVMRESILEHLNPLGILINALLLHGFSPDSSINNEIVRGGWFIGAIVILYAIFPLIYRIYFIESKLWKKTRLWLFPLSVFVASSIIVFVFKHFNIPYTFSNLFLQLTPFCLGFPLFELQKDNTINKVKIPLGKATLFFAISLALYFVESRIQHFYISIITVAFFYIIVFVIKSKTVFSAISGNSFFCRFFNAMGKYSFPIYLTHSYIAFDFCYIATLILSYVFVNDLLWFILLQPFAIAFIYFLGKIFDISIQFILSKLRKSI